MTKLTNALQAALDEANALAEAAGEDVSKIRTAIDRFAGIIVSVDNARLAAVTKHRELMETAFQQGVDPREFYNRPFTDTHVRKVYTDLAKRLEEEGTELPRFPRGRRPRQLPPAPQ